MDKTMNRVKIKEIFDKKMKEQGLSMRKLTTLSGLKSHAHISRILSGQVSLSRELLVRLARPLNCTTDELNELFAAARFAPPSQEELDDAIAAA